MNVEWLGVESRALVRRQALNATRILNGSASGPTLRFAFVLALLIGLAAPAIGQATGPTADEAVFATVRGGFLALSVADLDASERWYAEKLGLRRVRRSGSRGELEGFALLEGNGMIVELIKYLGSARPSATAAEMVQGITKAGVLVADFDRTVSLLRARGVEIVMGPYPARETVRANLVIKDNSGNLIQVFGDYARR